MAAFRLKSFLYSGILLVVLTAIAITFSQFNSAISNGIVIYMAAIIIGLVVGKLGKWLWEKMFE